MPIRRPASRLPFLPCRSRTSSCSTSDESKIHRYDRRKAEQALAEHGDAFRHQLVTAMHLEQWADSQERAKASPASLSAERADGIVWVLREVAANLRKGDYLPGGELYEQTARGA